MILTGPAESDEEATVLIARGAPAQLRPKYALKVRVPDGPNPPETVAVSETELPTTTLETDRVVETVGVALATLSGSEPQVLLAILLLLSPLYVACQV